MSDEINNNEQMSINSQNNVKKPSFLKKLLKALLIVLGILAVLCLILFGLYKTTVDVSEKNSANFDYDFSKIIVKKDYSYVDFLTYDSKNNKGTLFVDIPKNYIYDTIVDVHDVNAKLNEKYAVKINRFGTKSSQNNENSIDFCADLTYKEKINAYVSGTLRYEITDDNGVNLYLDKLVLGDGLPSFLYKGFIPIKDGDQVYRLDPTRFDFLKEKILDLSMIKNINVDDKSLKFEFDFMSNLKNIANYVFGGELKIINDSLENIVPPVMDVIINGKSTELEQKVETVVNYIIDELFKYINF